MDYIDKPEFKNPCPPDCHKCCSDKLAVSKREIKDIKEYIKKNQIKETNTNSIFSVQTSCPFLDEKGKCKIYEVRPEICRYYYCDPLYKGVFNPIGKQIISMLNTFYPCAYSPNNKKELEQLNQIFKEQKKEHGYND